MFRTIIFVFLLGVVLALSGCVTTENYNWGKYFYEEGRTYRFIETGEEFNEYADKEFGRVKVFCHEAIDKMDDKDMSLKSEEEEFQNCLGQNGYELVE